MQIFVKLPDCRTITLEVEPTDTIDSIKGKIQEKEGIPPDVQVLCYNCQELMEGHTLAHYGIHRESVLCLVTLR